MVSASCPKTRSPIQRLLDDGTTTGLADGELVACLSGREASLRDSAFQALVERHGPLVWRVCQQILRNAQDAEDAFQATFLVLLHKAETLRVRDSLGPWLYQVTLHVAQQARKRRWRRRGESQGAILEEIPQPSRDDGLSSDQMSMLHRTFGELPLRYREPIVLCHLEGRTHEEAARILRCPVGTVSGRLSRGRAMLRTRLERRGWNADDPPRGIAALSPIALALPPHLIRRCLVTSGQFGPNLGETTLAYQWMKGALTAMFWSRARSVLATTLIVCVATGATGVWLRAGLAAAQGARAEAGGSSLKSLTDDSFVLADPQSGAQQKPPLAASSGRPVSEDLSIEEVPPVVVRSVPEAGTTEVDPGLKELKVTFSKPMTDKSWSWATASKSSFPTVTGDIRYLDDGRTCVLPVQLQPGRTYATWVNSERFRNFKDKDGRPSLPYLLVFRTRSR